MCQFFWWGSPCTGQSTGGGPYLFFRSLEPLPGEPILRPLAGLYKTRISHLAGNSRPPASRGGSPGTQGASASPPELTDRGASTTETMLAGRWKTARMVALHAILLHPTEVAPGEICGDECAPGRRRRVAVGDLLTPELFGDFFELASSEKHSDQCAHDECDVSDATARRVSGAIPHSRTIIKARA